MLEIKFRAGEKERLWPQPIPQPRNKSQKRKKKPGPKTSSRKIRVKFHETAIGHFLFVYAPVEYILLMEYRNIIKSADRSRTISYQVIETIALNSHNPAFKTARFRRALISYRRFGLKPLRPTGWTLKDAVYYARNSHYIHEAVKQCTE